MAQFSVQLAPSQLAQTINPWSWTFGPIGPIGQVGLFNINLGSSGAPEVEARVLDEVGSYGRQLGRMGDAMKVLMAELDRSRLKPAQLKAIEALEAQLDHVALIKRQTEAAA